jgi:hypothetical protein
MSFRIHRYVAAPFINYHEVLCTLQHIFWRSPLKKIVFKGGSFVKGLALKNVL